MRRCALHLQAVGLIGTTAYFSYLVGEHLGLSGIVVIFTCSVTMSHYAMHNLSKTQRAATMSAFETLSYFSEGSIFVYVGLDALDPAQWKVCGDPHSCAAPRMWGCTVLSDRAVHPGCGHLAGLLQSELRVAARTCAGGCQGKWHAASIVRLSVPRWIKSVAASVLQL